MGPVHGTCAWDLCMGPVHGLTGYHALALQATEDQRKLASEKEAAREEVRQLRLYSREVPLGTDNMVVNFSKEVLTPGKVSC